MGQTIIDQDMHIRGTLSAQTLAPPAGCITDAAVAASAAIDASKLIRHQSVDVELCPLGTNVAAINKLLHIARAAGTLMGFEVAITGAMTGDRTVTIDLQRSTGGGAFATVLTATIGLTSATVVRTATAGTINTTAVADGDIYQIVVTLGGSSGTLAQGLLATLHLEEQYT